MTKLIYRGVECDADKNEVENRVYRRPQLVYRGVEHNGVRTLKKSNNKKDETDMIYRGVKAT